MTVAESFGFILNISCSKLFREIIRNILKNTSRHIPQMSPGLGKYFRVFFCVVRGMAYTRTCRALTKVKKIEWVYLFVFINSITLRYQILSDSDANSVNFLSLGGAGSKFSVAYQGPI